MNRILLLLVSSSLLVTAAAAQWSTPTLVANVNTPGSDFDPSPTFDGLTLYLDSSQPGNFELFRATRTAPYGMFGTPTIITELNSSATEAGPFARFDDLEIFFYTSRAGGGGGLDIWRADRVSTSVPFNTPVPVLELNSPSSDTASSLTFDGLRIYFATNRPGGTGNWDVWTATRPNWSSPFGTPTPVTELNTPGIDRDPHVSPDGLVIFFASDRPGGLGFDDVWMASRLDLASPFGNFVNLPGVNTSNTDRAQGFSIYYDELFFCSDRPGGPGPYDIHSTRFTGLLGLGIAGPGSSQDLRFSDPSSPGQVYVAVSSRGTSPGIPIDTRNLPLNFDLLFQLTIGGLPPILTGYVGVLDQDGIAAGRISFANFPQFVGLRFFTAFVVPGPAAPSGIKIISNAHEVLVQ